MNRAIVTRAGVLACAFASAAPAPAAAQQRVQLSGGPTLAHLRVHHEDSASFGQEARGAAEIGFEATVAFRRLALRIRYAQANLPHDTSVFDREAAAAELSLTGQLFPWLRLGLGSRRRTFDDVERTTFGRWVVWDAMAAAEFPFFGEVVTGSAELRGALAGRFESVTPRPDWSRGYAGHVSMRIELPDLPVWLRFGYRLEMYRLAGGVRQDLVDGLTMLIGVGPAR